MECAKPTHKPDFDKPKYKPYTEEEKLEMFRDDCEDSIMLLPQKKTDLYNIIKKTVDEEEDLVNHPKHYKSANGMEVIDVIEAFTADLKGIEATDTGNIIKYICRWKHKNGLQDLKKCQWYINHLIEKVEKESKNG